MLQYVKYFPKKIPLVKRYKPKHKTKLDWNKYACYIKTTVVSYKILHGHMCPTFVYICAKFEPYVTYGYKIMAIYVKRVNMASECLTLVVLTKKFMCIYMRGTHICV